MFMYKTIEDFIYDWTVESANTLKIFKTLTDSALSTRVIPDGRTLGLIAWHIVTSIGEMMERTGLSIDCPYELAPVPKHAQEIADAYEKASSSLLEQINGNWSDTSLEEERQMYGETWKNGFTLRVLIRHEIHHRAQMTILMRQAGLQVPGIYGPSREEWMLMGMRPQP